MLENIVRNARLASEMGRNGESLVKKEFCGVKLPPRLLNYTRVL